MNPGVDLSFTDVQRRTVLISGVGALMAPPCLFRQSRLETKASVLQDMKSTYKEDHR
jgi:hypothetical protein